MTQKRISRRRFLKDLTVTCTCSGLLANPITARYALAQDVKNDGFKDMTNMEYRPLGRTGLRVSAVSFGVMRLTEPAVLFEALEKGINYFDTAHVYQRGNNEEMLGNVLKEYGRKKVFIATKIPPYARFLSMNKLNSQSAMEEKMEIVDIFDLMDWNSDSSHLIGDSTGNSLFDPPGCIGTKSVTFFKEYKFLNSLHESDVSLLNEIF